MRRLLLPLLTSFALAACATGGSVNNTDEDATTDTSVADTSRDSSAAPDTAEDTAVEDTAVEDIAVEDTVSEDTVEEDSIEDVSVDTRDTGTAPDCEVVGDECEPASVSCAEDGGARLFCSRCGFIINTDECDTFEVCDESTGIPACRACEGDECPTDGDCEAGTRSCLDFRTVQVCGADGRVENTSRCSEGRRCFDGDCGSPGGVTGDACTQNINPDEGCQGHLCICGTEYVDANGAEGCTGAFADGFCSTANCTENRCDFETEVCVDFSGSGAYGGNDFCIPRSGCEAAGRNCPGGESFVCQELPARRGPGTLVWELGCWEPGLSRVGGTCTSDADCAGGRCEMQNLSGTMVSYCTSDCGADAGCPSNAVCAENRDSSGDYLCLARANATDCPRIDTELQFIRTGTFALFGGGNASACYFRR